MSFLSSFQRWFGKRSTTLRRRLDEPLRRIRGAKLTLEVLEDRVAPATLTVNTVADVVNPSDGTLSLRDAISAIDAGNENGLTLGEKSQVMGVFGVNDTIQFSVNGVITLASALPSIGTVTSTVSRPLASIQIIGPGATALTLSGDGQFQIFNLFCGTASIGNLTISNGYSNVSIGAAYGAALSGGITSNGSSEIVGSLTVSNCNFSNDVSKSFGGAIYSPVDDPLGIVCKDCTFTENSATYGGAISSYAGVSLAGCTFTENTSGRYGGAVALIVQWSLTVDSCTFSQNQSEVAVDDAVGGGAIYFGGTVATITNSIFSSNAAQFGSGGALCLSGNSATVTDCSFTGSDAERQPRRAVNP